MAHGLVVVELTARSGNGRSSLTATLWLPPDADQGSAGACSVWARRVRHFPREKRAVFAANGSACLYSIRTGHSFVVESSRSPTADSMRPRSWLPGVFSSSTTFV